MWLENASGFGFLRLGSHAFYGDKKIGALAEIQFVSCVGDRMIVRRALRLSQFIKHIINIGMLGNDNPVGLSNGINKCIDVETPFTAVR